MQKNNKQEQKKFIKEPTIPTPEFSELSIAGMESLGPIEKKAPKKLRFYLSFVAAVFCIVIGAIFIRQSQDTRRIATGPGGSDCGQSPDCIKIDESINVGSFEAPEIIDFFVIKAGTQSYFYPGSDSSCYSVTINQNLVTWEKVGPDNDCHDVSHVEIWMQTETTMPTPMPTTEPAPTEEPTPPPDFIAICNGIYVYDTSWNLLSMDEMSQLTAGDVMRLAASATINQGSVDKARFIINDIIHPETTLKKPGTDNEFYYDYVIKPGIGELRIRAELYHATQGWF